MLRLTITLILTFICINVYSQSSQTIGLHLGTTHSFRSLALTDANSALGGNILLNKAEDKTKTQFTAGFDYTISLTEKLSLKSGILYQNLGYNIPDATFTYPNENPFNGEITDVQNYLTIHSISLPVIAEYELLKVGNSSLNAGLGIIFSYVAKEEHYKSFVQNSETIEEIDGFNYEYNPLQIGGILDLSYEYAINQNLSINLTPSVTYYLNGNESNDVKENLYSFRSTLGLSYKL